MIQHYINLFGKRNVLALPLEFLRENSDEYERTLHVFSGSFATPMGYTAPVNPGTGAVAQALERKLNRHWKRSPVWDGDYSSLPRSYRATRKLVRIVNKVIPRSVHRMAARQSSEFIDNRVKDLYRNSNFRLSEMCGKELNALGYDT